MTLRMTHLGAALTCGLLAALAAFTAPGASAQGPADSQASTPYGPLAPDAEIARLMERLSGAWTDGEFSIRIAPVQLLNATQCLYVELVRTGWERTPITQLLLRAWRVDGKPVFRAMYASGSMNQVFTGLWALPEFFPRLDPERLAQLGDLMVEEQGDRLSLRSVRRMPAIDRGAIEAELELVLDGDEITWRFTGFGSDLRPVWGDVPITMRSERLRNRLERTPQGSIAIVLRPSSEGAFVERRDSIACKVNAVLPNGRVFRDSSREMSAVVFQLPDTVCMGFTFGVIGAREGEVRRIIVPPNLATEEVELGVIPPGTWVYYDVELVSVKPADS